MGKYQRKTNSEGESHAFPAINQMHDPEKKTSSKSVSRREDKRFQKAGEKGGTPSPSVKRETDIRGEQEEKEIRRFTKGQGFVGQKLKKHDSRRTRLQVHGWEKKNLLRLKGWGLLSKQKVHRKEGRLCTARRKPKCRRGLLTGRRDDQLKSV